MARIRLGRASIDEGELELRASRSGGPGGQGVNTTSSKVELRFDVGASSLTREQQRLVRQRLGSRITTDDVLIIQASEERSQHQNRSAAIARFRALVTEALTPPRRRRRRAGPSASQKRKRLESKRRRSEKKHLRKPPPDPR